MEPKRDPRIAEHLQRVFESIKSNSQAQKDGSDNQTARPVMNRFIKDFRMKPAELIAYLEENVVGQREAIRVLATKICGHYNSIRHRLENGDDPMQDVNRIKPNILLLGPTGVGKTFLLKLIAKKLGVPFVRADATKYTEAGYVGGDVEDIIRDLSKKTKTSEGVVDVELAQFGIVFIDEVDKIASSRGGIGPDVSRRGVQQALLTLVEDTTVNLDDGKDLFKAIIKVNRMGEGKEPLPDKISTKNILFVFSGAFPGIEDIVSTRTHKKAIGFGADSYMAPDEKEKILQHLRTEDLVKYGMETELVGRIPVRVVMNNLTEEDLYAILSGRSSPIIHHFRDVMSAYGTNVTFDDEVLRYIARLAHGEKTGARSLVSAFEQVIGLYEYYLAGIGIPSFNFSLPLVDGTIDAEEFLRSLQSVIPEKMAEIQKELESKQVSGALAAYADMIRSRHGLDLQVSFSEKAANLLSQKAREKKQPLFQVCESTFADYEQVFCQLAKLGKKSVTLTEESINDPVSFFEKAFSS